MAQDAGKQKPGKIHARAGSSYDSWGAARGYYRTPAGRAILSAAQPPMNRSLPEPMRAMRDTLRGAAVVLCAGQASREASSVQLTTQLLHGTITWVSPIGRRLLADLVEARGLIHGADALARRLGFRNRHHLKRQLEREGLPSLEVLCGWIRVLLWVEEWERKGVALSRGALRSNTDPAVRFRCVRRTTGYTWTQVRSLGSMWVMLKLLDHCRKPAHHEPTDFVESA